MAMHFTSLASCWPLGKAIQRVPFPTVPKNVFPTATCAWPRRIFQSERVLRKGQLVLRRPAIAMNYSKGWFLFDLAVVGIDWAFRRIGASFFCSFACEELSGECCRVPVGLVEQGASPGVERAKKEVVLVQHVFVIGLDTATAFDTG